jgi:hypothetical protein
LELIERETRRFDKERVDIDVCAGGVVRRASTDYPRDARPWSAPERELAQGSPARRRLDVTVFMTCSGASFLRLRRRNRRGHLLLLLLLLGLLHRHWLLLLTRKATSGRDRVHDLLRFPSPHT